MGNILKSIFLRLDIEVTRFIDQRKRKITGLPTLATSQITPNLFVGGQYKLKVFKNLTEELGLTAIVNMRRGNVHMDTKLEDIHYLHLPTPDRHAPTIENLKKGVRFIRKEIARGGKVYVHCAAGEGRGPTMVIAYLISTGLTFEDAFFTVKKVRKFINPTRPQIKRLKEFEELYKKD